MTIAEMRALLDLGDEYTDAQVVERYAIYLGATSATPSATVPPITVQMAKEQLKLDSDGDEDALIERYIAAAVDMVEGITGYVLSRRQLVESADRFGQFGMSIQLRAWPIVSVDAISYRNAAGEAALATGAFFAMAGARPARVYPTTRWPSDALSGPGLIAITVTAGFDGPEDVPAAVIQALLVMVAEFYRNREAGKLSADAERSVRRLLRRHIRKVL